MEKRLLAAIYKQPRDDDARRVYADWLQERGDPRGEFISLQLADGGAKKAQALLKTHGKAWLESLEGALVEKSVKWARGFPVSGRVNYSGALWKQGGGAAIAGVVALATLEELDLSAPNTVFSDAELWKIVKPLHHLLKLRPLPRALFPKLLSSKQPYALERVVCRHFGSDEQRDTAQKRAVEEGMRGDALPALAHLEICWKFGADTPEDFAWVAQTAAGRRLRSLHVEGYYFERLLPLWRAWFEQLPPGAALEEVELRHGHEKSEHFLSLRIIRRDGAWRLEGEARSKLHQDGVKKVLATPGVKFDAVDVK